ncbi:MAG: HD domain-containing protein [Magnetococcales bacterium]|nr:HD domain-containing protein [Magnetococcales bacterium]
MLLDVETTREDESLLARQLQELNDIEDLQSYILPVPKDLSYMAGELQQATAMRQQVEQILFEAWENMRQSRKLDLAPVNRIIADAATFMESHREAMVALILLSQRHETTYIHASNVAILLMAFGLSINLSPGQVRLLGLGGLLHDVGITRIAVNVLKKAGRLTPRERKLMELHPRLGFELLDKLAGLSKEVALIALQHHERYNGSGYPRKLFRDHIHNFAMMTSIVDTFAAMTVDRSWRERITPSLALAKMLTWSQSRFHPELLQQFIRCVGIYPVGTLLRFRNNLVGIVIRQNPQRLLYPVVRVFFDTDTRLLVPQQVINLMESQYRNNYEVVSTEIPEKWGLNSQNLVNEVMGLQGV